MKYRLQGTVSYQIPGSAVLGRQRINREIYASDKQDAIKKAQEIIRRYQKKYGIGPSFRMQVRLEFVKVMWHDTFSGVQNVPSLDEPELKSPRSHTRLRARSARAS
jgi:hypothetical protein